MKFKGVIYHPIEVTDKATFDKLPRELQELFSLYNSLIAFDGGFQIKNCSKESNWNSLKDTWLGENRLSKTYFNLKELDIPFAQDGFGDQFIFRENEVLRLSMEDGELEELSLSLNEFLLKIGDDPIVFLMLESFVGLKEMGIKLSPGELINVYPPFIFKVNGERSFKAVQSKEQISFLKNLYFQTKNLEDGDEVEFRIEK